MGLKYIEIYDLVQASPEDYLMHHGIKNQKWGVRRGPPYPLKNGINTKVKTRTKAAEQRAKEKQVKRAAKTAAKAKAKEQAAEAKREKNKTLQDKINEMSNEELKAKTNRLKLENDYRSELSKSVVKGKNFIEKSSDVLTTLKVGVDALDGFIKSGKKLLQTFGLVEQTKETPKDSAFDWHQWRTRQPGESVQQYANRLESLDKIRQKSDSLSKAEENEKRKKGE